VSSFQNICKALNEAPNQWWKEEAAEPMILETSDERYSFRMPRGDENANTENRVLDQEEEEAPVAAEDDDEMEFQNEEGDEVMGTRLETDSVVNHDEEFQSDDDEATAIFPIADSPGTGSLPSRRSCSLPSQSPECSMIAPAASQQTLPTQEENDDVDIATTTSSSTPKIANAHTKAVQVYIASELSPASSKTLQMLERQGRVRIVSGVINEQVVTICGNAEMETGDGWLVGWTYGFLWAVARGTNIMYASYLENFPRMIDKDRVIGLGRSA